ncbi:MAG: hypothetical protein IJ300_04810 [Clostridia bacterium]|nr:hypothetical protein [Clostridia bacterium]
MNYIGKWRFHSIGVINESGELTYMSAEEYLNSPMPYIDESDEDAAKDEIKERKQIIGGCVEICENGKLYMLMQLPEDVSQEEVDAAVAAGEISLRNGMLCSGVVPWEERNGELWFDSGIEGEAFGEATDTWAKGVDESGLFTFMTMRYEKE